MHTTHMLDCSVKAINHYQEMTNAMFADQVAEVQKKTFRTHYTRTLALRVALNISAMDSIFGVADRLELSRNSKMLKHFQLSFYTRKHHPNGN